VTRGNAVIHYSNVATLNINAAPGRLMTSDRLGHTNPVTRPP